jgi:hypothetical protein
VIVEADLTAWCEACVYAIDGQVDASTKASMAADYIAAMQFIDWAALLFSASVVAFKVAAELKDIELCNVAIAHAGSAISPGWRAALLVIGVVRRFSFLSALLIVIPTLVFTQGGDALQVCFNTVAILFICEVICRSLVNLSSFFIVSQLC